MWTTPDDVRGRWVASAPLSFSDEQIQRHIDDAEDVILAEFPSLAADVPDRVPKARVVRVVARMVIRLLRNGDGLRSTNQSTGPFSAQTTYAGDNPGEIYLTDEDRRDLGGRRSRRKAFSIYPGGVW